MTDDRAHLTPEDTPYAIRVETPRQVLWNRVSRTSLLFGVGMLGSLVLGRRRG